LIYIDTSALLKLIFDEAGSVALETYLPDGAELISSKLLQVEARRGTLRRAAGRLPRLDVLLSEIETVAISDVVIESAGRLPDPMLRSLDAIHLATALLIREDVDVLLSYDDRLTAAAAAHGIKTASPA
jgi:predicted nucleic acid-binding protein